MPNSAVPITINIAALRDVVADPWLPVAGSVTVVSTEGSLVVDSFSAGVAGRVGAVVVAATVVVVVASVVVGATVVVVVVVVVVVGTSVV